MSFYLQFLFPVGVGVLSAALAVLAQALSAGAIPAAGSIFTAPWAPLAAALLAWIVGARIRQARVYDGLADLFAHVHQPAHQDSPSRWRGRALISLALAAVGRAGPEGAAIELAQSMGISGRTRTTQWSEQRRRTDAATAVAAGAAAALGAPFAGAVLALELGLGGRSLSAVLAALAAGFAARGAWLELGLSAPIAWESLAPSFEWMRPEFWGSSALGAVAAALAMAALVPGVSLARAGFLEIERKGGLIARFAVAGVLLGLVGWIHVPAANGLGGMLDSLLWDQGARARAIPELIAQVAGFFVIVGGFGTAGVLLPVLTIGTSLGVAVGSALFAAPVFAILCGLAAAAAAWACAFSAPISSALLVYEFTQRPSLAAATFVTSLLATRVFSFARGRAMIDRQLQDRDVRVQGGRSLEVLESIPVQQAMITDFDRVEDRSSIEQVWDVLKGSAYPFLPVIDRQGRYIGLLTYEMVQEAWQLRHSPEQAAHAPLTRLLEAKDLLYRSGFVPPTSRLDEPLSRVASVLLANPCIPVLDKERQVLGLLLPYSVRLAYDRAVARRSLELETKAALASSGETEG